MSPVAEASDQQNSIQRFSDIGVELSLSAPADFTNRIQRAARPFVWTFMRDDILRDSPPFQLVPELAALPSEAVFDKISMSAFVGTPLDIAMRDCGLNAFAIVGIALEVGIEPFVRHALDLGYIPVVVTDACGSRDKEAAERAFAGFRFAGGSYLTDVATIGRLMRGRASAAGSGATSMRRAGEP